jgi:glutamate dehydrogenase
MASNLETAKRTLVEGVVRCASLRLAPAEGAAGQSWVRQVYASAPPRDLLGESADDLCGAALALWAFAAERHPGTAKVRVYQPTLERDGWTCLHTIVEAVNDDMPYLVDSMCAYLNAPDREVKLIVHPVVHVTRDPAGRRTALLEAAPRPPAALRESVIQIRLSEQPPETWPAIRAGLEAVLASVRRAMDDQAALRERLRGLADTLEREPDALPAAERSAAAGFLRWLDDNHFVPLGYRETTFEGTGPQARARIEVGASLGLLRDEQFTLFDGIQRLPTLPEAARRALLKPEALRVAKASRRSPVHRPVPLDVVSLPRLDAQGKVVGERAIIGLFPLSVYALSPRQIPFLQPKVEAVLARAGVPLDGHRGKQLLHILETYPRDELFQVDADELFELAVGMLDLQDRSRVALFTRRDPLGRFISCIVYAPRDRYDSDLRRRFGRVLEEAYGGTLSSFTTSSGDALARVHFLVQLGTDGAPQVEDQVVEERLQQTARSWVERMQEALLARAPRSEAMARYRRFAQAFGAAYQDRNDPTVAAEDTLHVEEALVQGLALHLDRAADAPANSLRFKVYFTGRAAPLSTVLPMLENLGVTVQEEIPNDVRPGGTDAVVRIREFDIQTADGRDLDVEQLRPRFLEAFAAVWTGEAENDGFNRLVVCAGLDAREVTILRAYCKYLRQVGIPFSQTYMEATLARNATIARGLIDLFQLRFDPARESGRAATTRTQAEKVRALLDAVTNLDEDRILRRFLNAIESTLRTNAYQTAPHGGRKPYISFKLDSKRVEELPLPKPFREIWVYSTRFEAIHLRGGKVARGGLRWSDRREDFRTEILGLMKAQMVKNAVIVPVGSKGGFVLKQAPEGREELQAEAVRCYKSFLSGLLDITDNLDGQRVVPPPAVVRHDEDDPYLVVAADKGTATFSDHANSVSAAYGFWLDDAFASGGSAGYDHKAIAITARGGWEAVKRHFREMGKDIQSQDTTCVGVGDMSGDVFGNAMLLSRHLRLLAAFDHRHVFVDPTPDAATSFVERQRLFALPRSSWADYDRAKISKGGGVFDRKAKQIPVSPEMRALFGLPGETVSPTDLMRAILKAEVELLWLGGIGTYVKASTESHADVGDRANEALRLDAAEVRAKVVGEGANLGLTQRGRIELALLGGRLNTDAIDNSGGVDCSDHEVNIKILLGDVEKAGLLDRTQRNTLLKQMTEEVSALVLRDNYLQTQAISVTHALSARLLDRIGRFMQTLEAEGKLHRRIEALPDGATLKARRGIGLTRPELCVLLAYAKIDLYDDLLRSDLPDDPAMAPDLTRYFPAVLSERYPDAVGRHRLKREIIATCLTNQIVNRVGISFVHEVSEKTGATPADVARAFVVVREAFDLPRLWRAVEALDGKVAASQQATMLAEAGRMVERATVWILRETPRPISIEALTTTYRADLAEAARGLPTVLGGVARRELDRRSAALVQAGVPAPLATEAASLPMLASALDLARLARELGVPVAHAARGYFAIGERFGFDWLRHTAAALPADSAWDKQAVTAVVDDLYAHQAALTRTVLAGAPGSASVADALERWIGSRGALVERADGLLGELQAGDAPNLAMLAVANRGLKTLAG